MKFKWLVIPVLLTIVGLGLSSCAGGNKSTSPPLPGYTGAFGISYPPVGTGDELDFTVGAMKNDLGVVALRFSAHWDIIQANGPGTFDWSGLDQRMKRVRDEGLELFLTVEAQGPDWACGDPRNANSCLIDDPQAFRLFVTALVDRYGDNIAFIQFGNEMVSPDFWAGTVEQFTELSNIFYAAVKARRPDMPVVLGGISTGVLRTFAACARGKDLPIPSGDTLLSGAEVDSLCATPFSVGIIVKVLYLLKEADYDALDLHLYDDPEYWPLLQEAVAEVAPGVPMMVTEFGGPRVDCAGGLDACVLGVTENSQSGSPYTESYHAGRLAYCMETLKAMGVAQAYHFKLVEDPLPKNLHDKSALYREVGGSIVPKQPLIDAYVAHK